ncbi:MAG: MerR family transcriptional regulator, partial [Burkholderiaceae bacterium]|nr:MerR family transcriptional regulator [Burkholderiaceae bacterium]
QGICPGLNLDTGKGNERRYSPADVYTFAVAKSLTDAGISLATIKTIFKNIFIVKNPSLPESYSPIRTCFDWADMAHDVDGVSVMVADPRDAVLNEYQQSVVLVISKSIGCEERDAFLALATPENNILCWAKTGFPLSKLIETSTFVMIFNLNNILNNIVWM